MLKDRPPFGQKRPFLGQPSFMPLNNAGMMFRSNDKYLDFKNGAGIRYLTKLGQTLVPLTPEGIFYNFQGITSDNKYFIAARFPVSVNLNFPPPPPSEGDPLYEEKWLDYNFDLQDTFTLTSDNQFYPNLSILDEMIGSLTTTGEQALNINVEVDPLFVSELLNQKKNLANDLQNVDIPTRIFMVPGLHGYDESSALAVVAQLALQLENGNLQPDQVERLERLLTQERSMQKFLVSYTEVIAAVSDTTIDTAKVILSYVNSTNRAWKSCQGFLCGKLKEMANKTAWRIIRNLGKQFMMGLEEPTGDSRLVSNAYDIGIRLIEDNIKSRHSFDGFLIETGIEYAVTSALIEPYLWRTQPLIDKGVRTAAYPSEGDVWSLTGDTQRADSLLNEITQKAQWESDLAVSIHQDFQKASNLSHIIQDISDLTSLVNPLFGAVNIGAKIEHALFISLPEFIVFRNQLTCIEYLATRGAEIAFDADQPPEDCRYLRGTQLIPDTFNRLVSFQDKSVLSPIKMRLHQSSTEYRDSLHELISTSAGNNTLELEKAIENFSYSQEVLSQDLEITQSIIMKSEEFSHEDYELLDKSAVFEINNLTLYIALAEILTAQNTGEQPLSELTIIANEAETLLDDVEESVSRVDLTLQKDEPALAIRDIKPTIHKPTEVSLEIVIENYGNIDVTNLRIIVAFDDHETEINGTLSSFNQEMYSINIPKPKNPLISIQVLTGNKFLDSQLVPIPLMSDLREDEILPETSKSDDSQLILSDLTKLISILLFIIVDK